MKIITIIGIYLLILGLVVLVLQSIWNAVLVDIFDLPSISYWKTFALFVFCRIMFGDDPSSRLNKD
jgi:uncharacterized membrane protein